LSFLEAVHRVHDATETAEVTKDVGAEVSEGKKQVKQRTGPDVRHR
jgi:hypothetical protein